MRFRAFIFAILIGSLIAGNSYAQLKLGGIKGMIELGVYSTNHKGDIKIQSVLEDTSDASCCYLGERGKGWWSTGVAANDKKSNDTLRLFIERCGFKHILECFGYPGEAFKYITDAVDGMDTVNSRWLEYRQWLKKVLYINLDSGYYCDDVFAMFATFNYLTPGRGWDFNGLIAIHDYLINNNRCPDETKSFLQQRKRYRDQEIAIWRDSVGSDSVNRPIDTSAVTIDQIGFSILRGPQFGVVITKNNIHGLGNLTATKNPFSDQTTLQTEIGDAIMLKLEIFDVLGRQLYTENRFFSAGDVKWTLDGNGLPEGSLYARISTISGDVKTIKLVRQ